MSRKQVEKHRDRFTKSQKNGNVFGPWKDHFTEMAKKTVLIKLLKTAPISIEQQETRTVMEGLQYDNSVSKVKEGQFGDGFIDAEYQVEEDIENNQPQQEASGEKPSAFDFGERKSISKMRNYLLINERRTHSIPLLLQIFG